MSLSKEEYAEMLDFGEVKYAMGYKDGYVSGIVTGALLASIAFLISNISR